MRFLQCPHLFLPCILACCVFCGDGRRIASSSSTKGAARKEAQAVRHAAATLAPERSKPLELKAERKLEQELASIQNGVRHGLNLYGSEAEMWQQVELERDVASVRDAIRHGLNPYGSKAWRAAHAVNIGVECQDSGVQIADGGSTIVSVHTESPKTCCAFCEEKEGCVAWSWNKDDVDKNCYAQHSCKRRVPKSNMVSGMKASFDGMWYYKVSDRDDFSFDEADWFEIIIDKTGEMSFESSDGEHGVLKMIGGSAHDAHRDSTVRAMSAHDDGFWNEELKAKLEGDEWDQAGSVGLRLTDGKIQLRSWHDDEENVTQFTAEKKETLFKPYDRVTVKQDQVIVASDVQLRVYSNDDEISMLNKGDVGTVYNAHHPSKTGVIFDEGPGHTVWVNDTLLVKSAILKEVSEHQVKDVLGNLGYILIHAIQDPITLEIFRDPVMASDGFTYERSSMEQLITRAEVSDETPKSPITGESLSSVKLSSNYAIRSLVSSVIEKVDASRAAAGKLQKRFRGYRLRKTVLGRGNVPIGWWATS